MKPEMQVAKLILFLLLVTCYLLLVTSALAITDPLSSPNNKFGIHIIGASVDEASPAATLVNSSGGDWGYITVLVESKNRDQGVWQKFFNDLRRRHLIPLVRLATQPEGNYWKRPYEGEEQAWADFLDNLIWPTKNRYVIVYNEPNHANEWGGRVDPQSYAQVLDKTIDALKKKNPDFFILNAGFDASTPSQPPNYEEEAKFLKAVNEEVPGIFNKLDGWVSHSYPNPGFVGLPTDRGKGTVGTWVWEQEVLKDLGLTKKLPVFITETGWKHAEGIDYQRYLPTADTVGQYFTQAFSGVWNSSQIVAITPFLLNYQEPPFDHFSFKKLTGEPQNEHILGISYPQYYSIYQTLLDLPKISGQPVQENKAELKKGEIYSSLVAGQKYIIPFKFKNTGQSIWEVVELRATKGAYELGITPVKLDKKVEPGEEGIFNLAFQAPQAGSYPISLQLFSGNQAFDQTSFNFSTEVKSPVILMIQAALLWKKDFSGDYLLSITSDAFDATTSVKLNSEGKSEEIEAKYLLPDYTFYFTLQKPFYNSKTVSSKVQSGVNNLDFGTLHPDLFSVLLKPKDLWTILPFSN